MSFSYEEYVRLLLVWINARNEEEKKERRKKERELN
jgi:hypothetical protein